MPTQTSRFPASPYVWVPVFDEPPALARVAPDVRPMAAQRADFGARARGMGARADEAEGVIEALQLCERTHGHLALARVIGFVEAAVACASQALRLPLSALAVHHGLGEPGLFVGALVEEAMDAPALRRAFGRIEPPDRSGSPHLEFEDVARGCRIAGALGPLSASDAERLVAFAELARAVRFARGCAAVETLQSEANAVAGEGAAGAERERAFALRAGAWLDLMNVTAPLPWRRWARRTTRG